MVILFPCWTRAINVLFLIENIQRNKFIELNNPRLRTNSPAHIGLDIFFWAMLYTAKKNWKVLKCIELFEIFLVSYNALVPRYILHKNNLLVSNQHLSSLFCDLMKDRLRVLI